MWTFIEYLLNINHERDCLVLLLGVKKGNRARVGCSFLGPFNVEWETRIRPTSGLGAGRGVGGGGEENLLKKHISISTLEVCARVAVEDLPSRHAQREDGFRIEKGDRDNLLPSSLPRRGRAG